MWDRKRTSKEWQARLPEVVVLNPDGWDRSNYNYSWNVERISQGEYLRRRDKSTCMCTA